MTRTLLVDTNRAAVPIYRALCAWGHDVWVVGGKPSETLAKLAQRYVQLDYSKPELLDAFIAEHHFDFVVPGCTDLSYKVCAEVNRGRFPGIESPEQTDAINTKHEFRKLATKANLPVPRVLNLDEALSVPSVIVKPVDSFSGRGMTVLHGPRRESLQEAMVAAGKVSRSGKVIFEEFITGQLYSHSAFLWNGAFRADFIVQEDCTTNPFTVDTSRVVRDFPPELLASIRRDILHLAVSTGFINGLIHTQFIVRGENYWVIEMTRRCPGDIYSLLIEFATGYPYAASYAAPFVGREPKARGATDSGERIIRHTVTTREGAALWGYRFAQPVEIKLFVPLATVGDYLGPSPEGRGGIFFFRANSLEEEDRLYARLLQGNLFHFNPEAL